MPRRGGFLLGIALAVLAAACGQQPDPALEPRTDAPATSASQEGRDSPGSPNARWGMIEDLREFRDAVRHPSDGGGRAWLEWPDGAAPKLEARGRGRFPLVFQVGPEALALEIREPLAVRELQHAIVGLGCLEETEPGADDPEHQHDEDRQGCGHRAAVPPHEEREAIAGARRARQDGFVRAKAGEIGGELRGAGVPAIAYAVHGASDILEYLR